MKGSKTVWLFDLDNTLHDASHAVFGETNRAMDAYIVERLGVDDRQASHLRHSYLQRYGATLLFLEETHLHPGLEQRVRTSAHDRAVLKRLAGRKYVLTNAPRDYSMRVLKTLRLTDIFDGVISIEDMMMFGQLRPKPDARLFRFIAAKLKVRPSDCVLVEDMLDNQKAAHGVGMRAVWMQRYLGGRYRGHLRGGATSGFNDAVRRAEPSRAKSGAQTMQVGVHPCPSPRYVRAKIFSFLDLLTL
jgi:putative hydrolase of the HAD superfamily